MVRVQACIGCSGGSSKGGAPPTTPPSSHLLKRLGLTSFLGLGWVPLAPLCLACTIPTLLVPLLAVGMTVEVAYGLHALSLVTPPLVLLVLWRHFRRHDDRLVVWVGGAGALLLVTHMAVHFITDGVPMFSAVADQAGTVLLLLGALLDARATRRWVANQRRRLARPWTALQTASAS